MVESLLLSFGALAMQGAEAPDAVASPVSP
ncbi:hypothetical protein MNBD_PLANCTO03-1156, partial [hydrothermal vent metagenome]